VFDGDKNNINIISVVVEAVHPVVYMMDNINIVSVVVSRIFCSLFIPL
jgi:hypothetical protein